MAGHLSPTDLAAIAVGVGLWIPIMLLFSGIMIATTPLVAEANGARDFNNIPTIARQSLWMAFMLGILAMLVLQLMPFLLPLFGVPENLRPKAGLFLHAIGLGMPAVTNEDRARGQDMAQHFQGLAFDALGGDQHEFDQKILKLIQKQEVGVRTGMALMACLGSRYRREVGRERVAEAVGKIGYSSVFQGVIGERIRRKITVLSKFAGRTFLGSVIRATDGENLYFWTSSKTVDHWPNDGEFEVIGEVKTHSTDQHGHQETRLTRVKIAT
jgi:hypothetical protein